MLVGRNLIFDFLSCNSILETCIATLIQTITSQDPLSDKEVVARVLAGETGMFEIVMRRYNQCLYRMAWAVLRNDTEAADVMQDAYAITLTTRHGVVWGRFRSSFLSASPR